MENVSYAKAVGSSMYAMTSIWPNISLANDEHVAKHLSCNWISK